MKACALLHKNEKGQSIIEAVMCMLFICLVLFSLLQIFYISVAQMFTDYAAFSSARSRSVGFADYLVNRNARVAAIGASGDLITNDGGYDGNPLTQFAAEYIRVQEYLRGIREIEYQYWETANNNSDTSLGINVSNGVDTVESNIVFNNYPMDFPMRGAFTDSEDVDIEATGSVMDHEGFYLSE